MPAGGLLDADTVRCSNGNAAVSCAGSFLPDILRPLNGKPARADTKPKDEKKKPTWWWAESISRGDMEETGVSINP